MPTWLPSAAAQLPGHPPCTAWAQQRAGYLPGPGGRLAQSRALWGRGTAPAFKAMCANDKTVCSGLEEKLRFSQQGHSDTALLMCQQRAHLGKAEQQRSSHTESAQRPHGASPAAKLASLGDVHQTTRPGAFITATAYLRHVQQRRPQRRLRHSAEANLVSRAVQQAAFRVVICLQAGS